MNEYLMPGITWIAILGGGIWLFKLSIGKLLDKSVSLAIERIKSDGQKEIEKLRVEGQKEIEKAKSDLIKILDRDKLVFGEIYKNRVSVLIELYKMLSGISSDTRYLVQKFYIGSSPDPKELTLDIRARLNTLNNFIRENAIYIPDDIEDKSSKLAHGVFWSIDQYITAKNRQETARHPDQFDKYYKSEDEAVEQINGEITELMKSLKSRIKYIVTDISNLGEW